MSTMPKYCLVFVTALSLTACGDTPQPENRNASSDIEQGWQATQAILDDATSVDGQALMAVDIPISFGYTCPGGGTAQFEGQAAANIIYGEADANFSYDVTFDGCSAHGVVIDGSLAYAKSAELRAGIMETSLSWVGELTWSGAVEENCTIDVTGAASVSMSTQGFSYESSMDGSICGADASSDIDWSI